MFFNTTLTGAQHWGSSQVYCSLCDPIFELICKTPWCVLSKKSWCLMKLIRKSSLFYSFLMIYKYSTIVRKKEKKSHWIISSKLLNGFPLCVKNSPIYPNEDYGQTEIARLVTAVHGGGGGSSPPSPKGHSTGGDPSPPQTPPNCGSCRTPCINNRCRHVALTPWGTSPPCATLDPTFNPPQTFHLHSSRSWF